MTVIMRISLPPDFSRWRRNKGKEDTSVMPCVLIFATLSNSAHMPLDSHPPLFTASLLGVTTGAVLSCFFY
ncbi:hypothetical protein JG687_00018860 [Phytophthora cactorum]|uniref:Uncharacterized protein n=1 Tax=Phytophthora cactorum TaxID=29920 RepID=A0A8T1TLP0_9STRA|nr:hypothetical protein JG687_00018860 [Phytophthora cactorum]